VYIRTVHKKNKNSAKVYTYHRLIHAYRIGDKRRQINILNLGKLEDLPKDKHKILADRIEEILTGKESLFPNTDDRVEKLAQKFAGRIKKKGVKFSGCESKPVPALEADTIEDPSGKDYQTIDINSLEEEDIREIGAEWLSRQAIDLSGLPLYLREKGYSEYQVNTMLISLICKMVHPSSEHEAERWLKENTALCELYNLEVDDITRHDLYRANNRYLKHKDEIEEFLYDRTFDLFSNTDRIIIYDLTNLYFEGRMNSSKKAKYGRCKSKRNDCKLIGLSMVVDIYGFVKHCDLYPGNISEPKTLSEIIDRIEKKLLSSENKPLVVMDAGISTEENLHLLKERGYDYISVSRQRLKEYQAVDEQSCVIKDKKGNKIELKKVVRQLPGRSDCYLYVKSDQKSKKEESIDGKLTQRFEERLEYLKEGLTKPRRLKKIIKVHEHIGRLKEQYSSTAKLYQITYKEDKKADKVIDIKWERVKQTESGHGVYFLRYSRPQLNEAQIWNIYNCIREVESTFRCLKNDLDIRPVFHQEDEHIESHIRVGIIGYQIVNIIRQRLKAGGINYSWKTIVQKMNTQKRSIIEMDRKDGKRVYLKLCSRPNIEIKRFYELMKFEFRPYTRIAKVVTQL